MPARSNSQAETISARRRLAYLFALLQLHLGRRLRPSSFDEIADDTDTYASEVRARCGKPLDEARALEIGIGQRPYRLITMQSRGCDALGIDLDQPLARLSLRRAAAIFRHNGAVRGLKTLLRALLFDRAEYRALARMLARRFDCPMRLDEARIFVGDASRPAVWAAAGGDFDLIYSENVFEHIPAGDLRRLLALMAARLRPSGLAIVTPLVFTGICGGHDIGWYRDRMDLSPLMRGPAWGHLTGETPPPDTYLNRLTLADYRTLFAKTFAIVREEVLHPDLGRRYLTPARRRRLAAWPEEELFSNSVRFVLARKG
jgi:hypothetical protein